MFKINLSLVILLAGILIGSFGTYQYMKEDDVDNTVPLTIREPDRHISPSDTSNQEEPNVEIRYKVRKDTIRDTIEVAVPSTLASNAVLSDPTPLNITEDVVEHTYWDIDQKRFKQRIYTIPQDNFDISLYGNLRLQNDINKIPTLPSRFYIGPSLEIRYKQFNLDLGIYTNFDDSFAEVGIQYEIIN